jgi:hypothetical protein
MRSWELATAFLKVKVNYGCTGTIARIARFLFGFGRDALSNAQAGTLDRSDVGVAASSDCNFCALMLGTCGSLVPGASSLSGGAKLSFFRDIETHVWFLVSLPVLILAEMIIHQRISPIVKSFVERHVVTPEEVPKFYAAIDSAMRMRNSVIAEVALLVFVFTSSHCL